MTQAMFRELKQSAYHKFPVSPDSPPASGHGSDIVLHLPVLEFYASKCWCAVEFGVRDAQSTIAMLAGIKGCLYSYDIQRTAMTGCLEYLNETGGLPRDATWKFSQGDSTDAKLEVPPSPTMILFDTLHTYAQLSKELSLWGRRATRYLAFHDTTTCGAVDRSGPDPKAEGIGRAIREFRDYHAGHYAIAYQTDANNGLIILERRD